MKWSLAWKWFIASLLIEGIMLSALVYSNVQQLSQNLLNQMQIRLETQRSLLQSALIAPWLQVDYATIQVILEEAFFAEHIEYLIALNNQSHIIASVGLENSSSVPSVDQHPISLRTFSNDRYDTRFDIVYKGQKLGALQIGLSTDFYTQAKNAMFIKSATIALLEIILSAILLFMLNRWIIRNLTKLTQSAHAIAQGEYTRRLELSDEKETIELAQAFNQMANAIQERISSLEEAHEEEKKLHEQLEHIAHYDALTNLPNRVLMADRLQQAMVHANRRNQSLAVVYLDLDGFKEINDAHGHHVGDELLMVLAERMAQVLQEGDTLSRIGGDEFAAVLIDVDEKLCEPILGRLLHVTNVPVMINGIVVQVSSSIGVTLYPQDGANTDQLMRHADQAMYLAKQAGKNRYHFFDLDQDASLQAQRSYIAELSHALVEKQLVLFFQPKVNMKTGEIIGAEALIRWRHPHRGVLSPISFLPMVEDHPLGIQIGEWVIQNTLQQLSQWQKNDIMIPISINISASQLQHDDFAERFKYFLEMYSDVNPHLIEIEILETSALEDIALVSSIMKHCRALGVRFALDDFGTGYSSLTYLKRLPVKTLKIDLSFVQDMLEDPDDLAIIEGILGLAKAFHKEVIAEGVESVEHGLALLILGCELAQGYGIAKPMDAQSFVTWMQTWKPDLKWQEGSHYRPSKTSVQWLFALVEHNLWVKSLREYVFERYDSFPILDAHACQFGMWIDSDLRREHAQEVWFNELDDLHQCLHQCGEEVVKQMRSNQHALAVASMAEVERINRSIIALLYKRIYT